MEGNKRVVFGVILLVGFCCFLLFEVTTVSISSVSVFKMKEEGEMRRLVPKYVSKRRVPNGPDPIHNRKIGNTRQTPDRV